MQKQYIFGILCIIIFGCAVKSLSQEAQEVTENVIQEKPTKTAVTKSIATKQQAIALIDKLIKANATFAVKLAHPLLPGKVRLWQQRGLVQFPTKQVPWTTFIKDVNAFGTHLHALLSRNPQTGDYYHLPKLQTDETLFKNLQTIEQVLATNEPKIEQVPSPFKLSKESLEALQKIINIYGTAFYQNKLLNQIEQLFKGFEPEAKKIRAQEEKAAERAGRGKKTYEDFEIPDFDISTDYDFGISADTEFTTPSYDIEPSPDLDLDFDISDDFIKSFFE